MKNKILGDIEPKCKYCAYGRPAPDDENVLCPHCGMPDKDSSCKKFKYDPLKREPRKPARLAAFSDEDFKL